MIHSPFGNKITLFDPGSNIKHIDADLSNLPAEIKSSKQLCFWKYIYAKNNSKPLKVPYGYSLESKSLVPSLKNRKHWFTFSTYEFLRELFPEDFQLGLVLTDGPFTVIDIDNYQMYAPLEKIIMSMLSKGAYAEISPSGKGLHIFFTGSWIDIKNKGDQGIEVQGSNVKITCEVYSGEDVRFITLTGERICVNHETSHWPMASFADLYDDLLSLKKLFFDFRNEDILAGGSMMGFSNSNSAQVDTENLNKEYVFVRDKILQSNSLIVKKYLDLCSNINTCYTSISEADWAFCTLVASFVPANLAFKCQLLEYFFLVDRPDRAKKNRLDYVETTIQKALGVFRRRKDARKKLESVDSIEKINTENKKSLKLLPSLDCDTIQKPVFKSRIKKLNSISKNSVLKVCNTMNIFYLGKSVKNVEYVSGKTDNYLKASIPRSLNIVDFRYYIQLLFQYTTHVKKISSKELAKDQFFPINIKIIFDNSKISRGGSCYRNFFQSLNKLAEVTLEYDKKISSDTKYRHIQKESLLAYKFIYKQSDNYSKDLSVNTYKKLVIRMHPIVLDLLDANYNYALLNKQTYDLLPSDQLKLLYYHFCLLTLPGCNSVTVLLDDLLTLWPKTNHLKTKQKRKREIITLLQNFIVLETKISDLNTELMMRDGKVYGVTIQKRKLNLV